MLYKARKKTIRGRKYEGTNKVTMSLLELLIAAKNLVTPLIPGPLLVPIFGTLSLIRDI